MIRTFVCLAAALGMLMFSGCGEIPGGGVVAAGTAPPKPAAPAAGDQDLKPTSPSLTPSNLPPVEAAPGIPAGGQPPVEQPGNGQPPNVAPPGTPPNIAPPAGTGTAPGTTPVTPPVAPPAKGADNLFNSLFGDTPPAKTPAPNGSGAPAGAPEINLSLPQVMRINRTKLHFEVSYVFTKGQPTATNWYTVFLQQGSDAEPQAIRSFEVTFKGTALMLSGRLDGDARLIGSSPNYVFSIFESTSKDDKGRLISNVVKVEDKAGEANGVYGRPAAPGVGAQGKGYGAGLITTPVSAYFAAKELIVFTAQIPKAMQLFNALNNRNPNSQEEFMEKIIKDNRIALPELPPGERYVYDPQAGRLMVEHPSK